MNKHQLMVAEFHKRFEVTIEPRPTLIEQRIADLRIKLIREELNEFIDAINAGDIIEIADALADLDYVVQGAGLAFGIDLEPVFAEVHRSNMSKGLPEVRVRDDGKILKGEDYTPPDIAPIINAQRNGDKYWDQFDQALGELVEED